MYYVQVHLGEEPMFFDTVKTKLNERGFAGRFTVIDGGWVDTVSYTVAPCVSFNNEDDALVFAISCASNVSQQPPRLCPTPRI